MGKYPKVTKTVNLAKRRLARFEMVRQRQEIPSFTVALELAMDWWLATYPFPDPGDDPPPVLAISAVKPSEGKPDVE